MYITSLLSSRFDLQVKYAQAPSQQREVSGHFYYIVCRFSIPFNFLACYCRLINLFSFVILAYIVKIIYTSNIVKII